MQVFDVCVVGAGLVGAAAARHAAEYLAAAHSHGGGAAGRVCCIGPRDNTTGTARGSHTDVARITRRVHVDSDPTWALLAARSMQRYRALEALSGIPFYDACGSAFVLPDDASAASVHANLRAVAAATGGPVWCEELRGCDAIAARFPFFSFRHAAGTAAAAEAMVMFLEPPDSGGGTVDPTRMIAAQLAVASRLGCVVVPDVVTSIRASASSGYVVATSTGAQVQARVVLVAAGMLQQLQPGLVPPSPHVPRCQLMCEQAVLLEVATVDAEGTLRDMPSLISRVGAPDEGFYMLPPRRYAEHGGAYFVKAGPTTDAWARPASSLVDALAWLDSAVHCAAAESSLETSIRCLFPGVRFGPRRLVVPCVCDNSPASRPVVAHVDGRGLHAFVGGNGAAAKSSDELGRILAVSALAPSGWPDDAAVTRAALRVPAAHL